MNALSKTMSEMRQGQDLFDIEDLEIEEYDDQELLLIFFIINNSCLLKASNQGAPFLELLRKLAEDLDDLDWHTERVYSSFLATNLFHQKGQDQDWVIHWNDLSKKQRNLCRLQIAAAARLLLEEYRARLR